MRYGNVVVGNIDHCLFKKHAQVTKKEICKRLASKLIAVVLVLINTLLKLYIDKTPEVYGSYLYSSLVFGCIVYSLTPPLLFLGIGSFFEKYRNKKSLFKIFIAGLCFTLFMNIRELLDFLIDIQKL